MLVLLGGGGCANMVDGIYRERGKSFAAEHDEESGEVINWLERYLVPPMLSLIQEQHKEIEILKTEINELKEKTLSN